MTPANDNAHRALWLRLTALFRKARLPDSGPDLQALYAARRRAWRAEIGLPPAVRSKTLKA